MKPLIWAVVACALLMTKPPTSGFEPILPNNKIAKRTQEQTKSSVTERADVPQSVVRADKILVTGTEWKQLPHMAFTIESTGSPVLFLAQFSDVEMHWRTDNPPAGKQPRP